MITKTALLMVCLMATMVLAGCGDTLSVQSQSHRQQLDMPVKRVAVVDFAGESGQAVADMLTMHLQRAGFEVVERQYLSDLLRGAIEPIKKGQTDATLTERMGKMGRLINADAIITGDLVKMSPARYERETEDRLKYEGAVCELSARAFDVRTREVFWTAVVNITASAKDGKQLKTFDYINEACAELAMSLTKADYQSGARVFKGDEIASRRAERERHFAERREQ